MRLVFSQKQPATTSTPAGPRRTLALDWPLFPAINETVRILTGAPIIDHTGVLIPGGNPQDMIGYVAGVVWTQDAEGLFASVELGWSWYPPDKMLQVEGS